MPANRMAAAMPPKIRYGRRAPIRVTVRSEIRPVIGFRMTSQAFGSSTRAPASPARTPSESVRYGSRSRPGTVPKAPVVSEPSEYPNRTDPGSWPVACMRVSLGREDCA
jgi:hypothetical protein